MRVKLTSVLGCGSLPQDRSAAEAWLARSNVPLHTDYQDGRKPLNLDVSDLPEPERIAYLTRVLEADDLTPGTYDDEAHAAYLAATPSVRAEGERRAGIARLLMSLGSTVGWADRQRIVQERFGTKGTSKPSLKRILRDVKGVDPINFGPVLMPAHKGRVSKSEVSDEAWSFFMTTIRDAGPEFPLKQAWRDTRDVGAKQGWHWPTYQTIHRRWDELGEVQRYTARYGKDAAVKRFALPIHRDKTTIGALEWVSLDGRTQDFWVDMGDGKSVRPTMLALVDVASNMVLGWRMATTENAVDTVQLIRDTCQRHGIFDRLYTDNGSAFAGHLVAGGSVHRFRNGGKKIEGVQPLGVCHHLGITVRFALPRNAKAKIAERTFATLSRVIDDRPEFKDAHAGHTPGTSPDKHVTPIPIEKALDVVGREIHRHNSETGRRSQGAKGRSYEQVFQASLRKRAIAKPTVRQHYLAGLIYSPVAVDRNGQVKVDTWVYGSPLTQELLLEYHGGGQRILLGRDPHDLSAPALAFDENGKLICEGIMPIERGAYGSKEGARQAARNRKDARDAVAKADGANNALADATFKTLLGSLPTPGSDVGADKSTTNVVAGHFKSPLSTQRDKRAEKSAITPEMMKNLDRCIGFDGGKGGR